MRQDSVGTPPKVTSKNSLRYVDWRREADIFTCDKQEINDILDSLDKQKEIKEVNSRKTVRTFWYDCWYYNENEKSIYCADEEGKYFIYKSELGSKNLDRLERKGTLCAKALFEKFTERTGQSKSDAFGYFTYNKRKEIEIIHKCNRCVGPFIWSDSKYVNRRVENVWKADVSSAYPFSAGERLPDAKTAILVEGMELPSEEWPVAFYSSGHVAEYGMYDTWIDMHNFLYKFCRGNRAKKSKHGEDYVRFDEDNNYTILMKYSEYSLKEEFEYFYSRKKTDDLAKDIMNCSIGTFDSLDWDKKNKGLINWKSHYSYYGHLRAVILARHNHRMCQEYDNLMKKGYKLITVQTDSLMWIGGPYEGAVKEKKIGNLISEIEDGYGFIHGCGGYFVNDNKREEPIVKAQGIPDFPKDEMKTMEDFIEWFRTHKKIEIFSGEIDAETHKYKTEIIDLGGLEDED